MDGLKRYVNDDRFRVDGDKNMRLLAFAFTIVFVWTGPKSLQLWVVAWSLGRLLVVRLHIKRRCAKEVSVYVIGCQKL